MSRRACVQNAPPVCPWENNNCCMAWLFIKQHDFMNQVSKLGSRPASKKLVMNTSSFPSPIASLNNPIEMVHP